MPRTLIQPRPTAAAAKPIDVPAWARRVAGHGDGTLVNVRVADAIALDADALRSAVRDAYREAFAAVGVRHVVRAWNVIPGICEPLGDGDRYMAFNAGRHDAMRERFGDALPWRVPAASGVGGAGSDLRVALLATREPAEPVENPRQTPAFRYSPRYGPLPPCFARATRATVGGAPRLLVAGTAAIVGEDTRAAGDASAQLALTLDNLLALLAADGGQPSLDRFEHVRVYLPAATFGDAALRAEASAAFTTCGDVECVAAELCRRNLLIEIEGVARRAARNGHGERIGSE